MTLLCTCDNLVEAQEFQSLLNANGIECKILEDTSPIMGIGGKLESTISLFVNDADIDVTRNIVGIQIKANDEKLPWCPNCGSEEVEHTRVKHRHAKWFYLPLAPLLIVIGLIGPFGPLFNWIFLGFGVIILATWFAPYTEDIYKCNQCNCKFHRQ